ncbi:MULTISPECIES: small, acid-soluble spore protein L [Bacillaceae]|uniref:Small, acid-soluble spore protein L n=1 Tax=Evansella alkalicola TaxID=745819 RepID=A0ABS6JU51_9BACI|nr:MULTISPECIES: small, acid-soluble spore protein L [Bacillaceae]MBU9722087.1 small, acid-soluble spore protein L [Bacillus alkalicola]
MGKQRSTRSQNSKVPGARSVNPMGQSPGEEHAGEVYSQGQESAKKSNTKR